MPLLSRNFSLSEFVEAVKHLSFKQIIADAENEVALAEHASFKVKNAAAFRKRGSVRYAEKLKGLLFLLRTGRKPLGVAPLDFILFRPIIERLVKKGQLKPAALDVFKDD